MSNALWGVAGIVALLWGVVVIVVSAAGNRNNETARDFRGNVISKRRESVQLTTGSRTDHLLVIETDEGETVAVQVSSKVFSAFEQGDQVIKRAGERWPTKVPMERSL